MPFIFIENFNVIKDDPPTDNRKQG